MPKTIAITPSWYWPQGVPRVIGIPRYTLPELCVDRPARLQPDELALTDGESHLSAADLKEAVDAAAASFSAGQAVELSGAPAIDNVINLFAALRADAHILFEGARAASPDAGSVDMRRPVVTIPGPRGDVKHSHRSLLAAGLALTTFFETEPGRPWLVSLPLWRWEGLVSLLSPLLRRAPAVLASPEGDPEDIVALISRENVGLAFDDLDAVMRWTRESKKAVKNSRRVLDSFLLSVSGMFDPDARRRVSRAFECPALTVYGTPETAAIFASHASWYLDESVGLGVTNMHIIPADPRTGEPIQALWELVESAEVTVYSPSLFCADESAADRFAGNRYRTGVSASSDANGMMYMLGEGDPEWGSARGRPPSAG